jgi:hypothetical protein
MRTGRRTVLKGVAASALTGVAGVVGAERTASSAASTALVTRPFDDPISVAEINDIRRSQFREHGSNSAFGRDLSAPSGRVVAYVSTVTEDGALTESIGIANRPRDVDKAHREAETERSRLEQADVGTASTSSSDSNWTIEEEGKVTNYANPYGDLVDYYEWLQNDDAESGLCYKEQFSMFPGTNEYDSDWYCDGGEHKEQWSQSGPTTEIEDWEPLNGTSGSTSESVEVSGTVSTTGGSTSVAYGYTYTSSEIDIDDKASDQDNYSRFTINIKADARDDTCSFEPASLGEFVNGSPGRCVTVTSDATFEQSTTGDTETISNIAAYDHPSGDDCSGCQ